MATSHIEDEGGGGGETCPPQAEQVRASRAQVGARSRSRGRTPSELLARKQQLLSAADLKTAPTVAAAARSGGNPLVSKQLGAASQEASMSSFASQSAAEMRLVSLSEMLKSHTNEISTAQQDVGADSSTFAAAAAAAAQVANSQQQQQQHEQSANSLKSIDDVYILLAKKEKDLQLAAELGKVLLERNDELSKANERIAEEYSRKLEVSALPRSA